MKKNKITIIGATGKVGQELVATFSSLRIPCHAVTRTLSKGKTLPFVTWEQADLEEQENLTALLTNTKRIFLSTNITEQSVTIHSIFIEVAKEVGVEHIVYLSSPAASADSKFKIGQWHWQVEEALRKSGIKWTILRPQAFMQNWLGELAESVRKERKIYEATGDGKKPFIDTRDIAEVAFNILNDPIQHVNKAYHLSGGDAVSYNEVAEAISKAINEKVNYVPQTLEEAEARFKRRGFPSWIIQTFLAIATQQREGASEKMITTTVQDILGKPPRSIYHFAKDHFTYFK